MSESASGEAVSGTINTRKDLSEGWLREKYHGDGMDLQEIGELVGYSSSTIGTRMEELGIDRRNSGGREVSDERLADPEWFREAYHERGMSVPDIAEECGVAKPSAQEWKLKHGIETNTEHKSRGVAEENPTSGEWRDTECYTCGVDLHLPKRRFDRADKNFCSEGCRIDYTINEVMVPGEDHPLYINGEGHDYGPEWPQIRERVIQRDDERCQGCGISREDYKEDLHAHHITPFRMFDDREKANALDNLVALCGSCHRKYEGLGIRPALVE